MVILLLAQYDHHQTARPVGEENSICRQAQTSSAGTYLSQNPGKQGNKTTLGNPHSPCFLHLCIIFISFKLVHINASYLELTSITYKQFHSCCIPSKANEYWHETITIRQSQSKLKSWHSSDECITQIVNFFNFSVAYKIHNSKMLWLSACYINYKLV